LRAGARHDLGQGRCLVAAAAAACAVGVAAAIVLPWIALAVTVYAMIFCGGFFEKWGLNHALTVRHYLTAFGVEAGNERLSGPAAPGRRSARR
jgi:iron(III) transport system permease protein